MANPIIVRSVMEQIIEIDTIETKKRQVNVVRFIMLKINQ